MKNLAILAAYSLGCSHSTAVGSGYTEAQNQTKPDRNVQLGVRGVSGEQINGTAFPDRVIALTWDDGPDFHTVELARYLTKEHISATFFVVKDWRRGLSSDPGSGRGVFSTGYASIPVLSDLVALGHRLGNHTQNHLLLTDTSPQIAVEQISTGQRGTDPYAINELRLFRAPGGAWNNSLATAADSDAYLDGVLGPLRWDVDRKDWGNSVECNSEHPGEECEHKPNESGLRVKPAVTARRYLDSIVSQRHGIVLLHDRVGDVGSLYALELARVLVPALKSRGYVFSAPVLQFSPLAERLSSTEPSEVPALQAFTLQFATSSTGLAYLCGESHQGPVCIQATRRAANSASPTPFTEFSGARIGDASLYRESATMSAADDRKRYSDIDGDGLIDYCTSEVNAIICGLGTREGRFANRSIWWQSSSAAENPIASTTPDSGCANAEFWLADIDGDGRSDLCRLTEHGLLCALSQGHEFRRMVRWYPEFECRARDPESPSNRTPMLQFGDVNGDGRADLCIMQAQSVACALSTGFHFESLRQWSTSLDFSDPGQDRWFANGIYRETARLGDLNGDGRADLCGQSTSGIVCALSTGSEFLAPTLWLQQVISDSDGWLAPQASHSIGLIDLNGDGRADLCENLGDRVLCAMAP